MDDGERQGLSEPRTCGPSFVQSIENVWLDLHNLRSSRVHLRTVHTMKALPPRRMTRET